MHEGLYEELVERLDALPVGRGLLGALGDLDGVYLVGGAVRDLLRGGAPTDLDLVFDRDVSALARELSASSDAQVRVHERFGTATISVPGGRFDLARARREHYPRPGALPEVEPAPIEEDLRRRDFTVNALALGLAGARRGELLAVPGALSDLEAGTLRVLHDTSFRDDPTRLLRLARYASRLGFTADPATAALAAEAVAGDALETVSGARLGAELRLLAGEAEPAPGFAALRELEISGRLIGGLAVPDPGLLARERELLGSEGDHMALVVAAAAFAVAPGTLAQRLRALAFDASQSELIVDAVSRGPALGRALTGARRPSEIVAAVGRARPELVAVAGGLGGPAAFRAASRWLAELRHVALEIDGDDLLAAGLAPGPAVGAGLRAALIARLDGDAAGRDAQLAEALRAGRALG